MPLRILSSPPLGPEEICRQIEAAIAAALPGARASARAASPGHFEIEVVCEAFDGKSRVQQQQLVYRAITKLLEGEDAPVHAVDRLVTRAR